MTADAVSEVLVPVGAEGASLVVPGRSCGTCTLCCKVMAIKSLEKPHSVWCGHCKPGRGCGIYESRPHECRVFYCGYMVNPRLTPEWKPEISHLVISSHIPGQLTIMVDPARRDAWRKQPYYGVLKDWSGRALLERKQLVVLIGLRAIMLFPDRDVDLGVVGPDEIIMIHEMPMPGGMRYDAYVGKSDSEAGQQIAAAQGGSVPLGAAGPPGFRQGKTLP